MRPIKLIVSLAILFVATSAIAAPVVIKVSNRKFDHATHLKSSTAKGKPADCSGCHQLDANGAQVKGKEHTRCNNCHGPGGGNMSRITSCDAFKQSGPGSPSRVCQICHPSSRPQCLPGDLPALTKGTQSFEANFAHDKHLKLGKGIEKDCAQCHEDKAQAPPTKAAHVMCSGCHNPNGVKPSINECAGCHKGPQPKNPTPPDPFRLTGFNHKNHHAASKNSANCTSCHVRLADGNNMPRPAMLECQKACHDGKTSFSAVGTTCSKCHVGTTAAAPVRVVGFNHAQHGSRNVKVAECSACHSLETTGELIAPLKGQNHAPCSNPSCHQTEFASRTTKICGVCHDSVAPWAKAIARYPKVENKTVEYFETINHAAHIAKVSAENKCLGCHGNKLKGEPAPENHKACAGCHGRGEGPPMTQCATCHVSTPPAKRPATEWSVRATFPHKKHENDPRGSNRTTVCAECHSEVKNAKDLASIKAPTMAGCESCHNGKNAFKTTGFECSRCHSAPPKPAANASLSNVSSPLAMKD
jgi:c(7)-type cytochrome triheme protein